MFVERTCLLVNLKKSWCRSLRVQARMECTLLRHQPRWPTNINCSVLQTRRRNAHHNAEVEPAAGVVVGAAAVGAGGGVPGAEYKVHAPQAQAVPQRSSIGQRYSRVGAGVTAASAAGMNGRLRYAPPVQARRSVLD